MNTTNPNNQMKIMMMKRGGFSKKMMSKNQLPKVVALGPVRLFALFAILVLIVAQLAASNLVPQPSQLEQQGQGNYNNLVEDLISDLMQNAGDRLKKSKASGVRQVKQTLRFGRRSDPAWLMVPTAQEQLAMEEMSNRRFFSD